MARNGSGTYSRAVADYVYNTVIDQAAVNAEMDDIATALTNSLAKDGQTVPTATLPMGTYRHTGVGNAASRTDYAAAGQVQDGKLNWVDGGGTADALTATYSPAITALVDGQLCCVRATAANATTTPTFAPSGLTARTIVKVGGTALAVGDIAADGHELQLRYDLTNTRWELLNPRGASLAANTFTGVQRWAKGADVASGAALTLGTDGNYFDITGTTAITSIGTLKTGANDAPQVKLHFDAALTLTHHATDLILPGAANITTAAGDEAEFVEYATGDWRCTNYVPAAFVPTIVAQATAEAGTDTAPRLWTAQRIAQAIASLSSGITLGTPVASTSGTSIDFTSIPSGTKKIIVNFINVSTNGTSNICIQLGDSGGVETTGYIATTTYLVHATAVAISSITTGFDVMGTTLAAGQVSGSITFSLENSATNTWCCNGMLAQTTNALHLVAGYKALTSTLDRLRITTVGGVDTFDVGEINISYEA